MSQPNKIRTLQLGNSISFFIINPAQSIPCLTTSRLLLANPPGYHSWVVKPFLFLYPAFTTCALTAQNKDRNSNFLTFLLNWFPSKYDSSFYSNSLMLWGRMNTLRNFVDVMEITCACDYFWISRTQNSISHRISQAGRLIHTNEFVYHRARNNLTKLWLSNNITDPKNKKSKKERKKSKNLRQKALVIYNIILPQEYVPSIITGERQCKL